MQAAACQADPLRLERLGTSSSTRLSRRTWLSLMIELIQAVGGHDNVVLAVAVRTPQGLGEKCSPRLRREVLLIALQILALIHHAVSASLSLPETG